MCLSNNNNNNDNQNYNKILKRNGLAPVWFKFR